MCVVCAASVEHARQRPGSTGSLLCGRPSQHFVWDLHFHIFSFFASVCRVSRVLTVSCGLCTPVPDRGPGDNPDTATHSHAMMWYNAALCIPLHYSTCTTPSCTPCTLNSLALLTLPHPIICRRVHGPKASVSQHAHGRMSLFESAKVSACKGSASPSAGGVSVVIVERMAYSVNTPTSGREGGLVPCIRSTA